MVFKSGPPREERRIGQGLQFYRRLDRNLRRGGNESVMYRKQLDNSPPRLQGSTCRKRLIIQSQKHNNRVGGTAGETGGANVLREKFTSCCYFLT